MLTPALMNSVCGSRDPRFARSASVRREVTNWRAVGGSFSVLALASALLLGCGSDPKPKTNTPAQPTSSATAEPDDAPSKKPVESSGDDAPDTLSKVGISDRIRKLCELPEARFNFDSAAISDDSKKVLDKLAECFIGGAAKGKDMRIVGHADRRGETEYNFALGQRRAGAVAGYLLRAGMAEERVATSSRGELEATGTDADGWSRDRRVEILLAE